jgi:hypothetical protein
MKIRPVGAALIRADRQTDGQIKLEKLFSARHPLQMNYKIQRFGDQLHLHRQGDAISYHFEDGDGVGFRNVGFSNSSDAAVCQRIFIDFCRHDNLDKT